MRGYKKEKRQRLREDCDAEGSGVSGREQVLQAVVSSWLWMLSFLGMETWTNY